MSSGAAPATGIIEPVATIDNPQSSVLSSTPAASPYFADLYTFTWNNVSVRTSAIGAIAVALCLFIGVFSGHPGAGLIAGGGAMTIGFGVNQRIADSRLWPMIAATFAMALSTVVGMTVGHHGFEILIAAALWSFAYGLLTARAAGVAWVGQQAAVTLFVTSAFPASLHNAGVRALILFAGCSLQVFLTSLLLNMLPELKKNLLYIPSATLAGAETYLHRRTMLQRLRAVPSVLPRISREAGFSYALRLSTTVVLAAELYRRLGIQSGYWIPMTALLVQKPAFFETLTRALLRIAGTLAGAVLSTYFLVHIHTTPFALAALATTFAFLSFATNTVNYGLFSLFLTSYIVFLLSLNVLPGPMIAHRRALCTIAGGLIALVIHLDGLRRHHVTATNL